MPAMTAGKTSGAAGAGVFRDGLDPSPVFVSREENPPCSAFATGETGPEVVSLRDFMGGGGNGVAPSRRYMTVDGSGPVRMTGDPSSERFEGRVREEVGTVGERRWSAGQTTRRNGGRWSRAQDNTLDEDLEQQSERLRVRTNYELANNGILEGVVESYLVDVLGDSGPKAQLSGAAKGVVREIEQDWERFWARAGASGESGFEHISVAMRSRFSGGAALSQVAAAVPEDLREDPTTFRLAAIPIRQLKTPFQGDGKNIVRGVELSGRRPVAYWVEEYSTLGVNSYATGKFTRIPAEDVIHWYRRKEAGQVSGVPLFASVLDDVADVRDYDAAVLDAAEIAAQYAAMLEQLDPDTSTRYTGSMTLKIEPRTIKVLPPNTTLKQMNAVQPTTNYTEFRRERLRAYGMPIGMPLHRVLKDSSKMNYSSMRGDSKDYWRHRLKERAEIERVYLNRVFDLWLREWELRRGRVMRGKIKVQWVWPAEEYVDPVKEGEGAQIAVGMGKTTFAQLCAEEGLDWADQLEQLAAEVAAFRAAGLVHPYERQLAGVGMGADPANGGDGTNGTDGTNGEQVVAGG